MASRITPQDGRTHLICVTMVSPLSALQTRASGPAVMCVKKPRTEGQFVPLPAQDERLISWDQSQFAALQHLRQRSAAVSRWIIHETRPLGRSRE